MDDSTINWSEEFPHLERAPIVEAVLEIRARAEIWNEQELITKLKTELPDYPKVLSQREVRHEIKMGPGSSTESKLEDRGMKGFRFESADGNQIAQFNRDGFVFSRLAPYEGWLRFSEDFQKLWRIATDLMRPTRIQRLGLRFINRIPLIPQQNTFSYYLVAPPQTPPDLGFPLSAFLHRDSFDVPGWPYIVSIVKTVQPELSPMGSGFLIFDIDVASDQAFSPDNDLLQRKMSEMRLLKNKFFFGSITPTILELFK